MSKKYMPNNAMTDRMGYEIVQALNGVAEALGGDNAILICHAVDSYPGEGTDPYEGQYEPSQNNEEDKQTRWLDVPFGKIFEALMTGKPVYLIDYGVKEENGFRIAYSTVIPIHEAMKIIDYSSLFGPMEVHLYMPDQQMVQLYAKNDTDYPCSRNMVWTDQR